MQHIYWIGGGALSWLALAPNKDPKIETLRGLAVILMVAGHVVGSQPEFAMQVPDDSPWRFVFWGFQDIRMPLFTVLSGYLYAVRPVTEFGQWPNLVKAKVRRLLIPLIVVGTLLFWTKLVIPGTNSKPELSDWWRPYIVGMDHLWFLQAIFLIFLAIGLLDVFGAMSTRNKWAIVAIAAGALHLAAPGDWGAFGISGAVRLLPFFLIGYGFKRFALGDAARPWVVLMLGVFAAAYVPRILAVYGVIKVPEFPNHSLALIVSVSSVCLLFWLRRLVSNKFLAGIGQYAFGIYLLHYFAASAARIVLRVLHLDINPIIFAGGMLAGVGLPILFQIATRNSAPLRLLFLGEDTKKKGRRKNPQPIG